MSGSFGTARIAGIMGAKKTSELIPMCHPLMLTKVSIDFEVDDKAICKPDSESYRIACFCTAKLFGKTGVEMEALTGVSTALLTVYDMCKSIDKSMIIDEIYLVEKNGGKSGHIVNERNSFGL